MNLSRAEALSIYTVLAIFQYQIEDYGIEEVNSLRSKLKNYLLDSETTSEEEAACEEEETEEESVAEEAEDVKNEDHLYISKMVTLPSARVTSPSGDEVDLEFEDSQSSPTCIDALVDGGSLIIEGISSLKITPSSVDLYDGQEWHNFEYKKLPKIWTKNISLNRVYGFEQEN